ncbi:MAG: hypothetical protein E6Q59_01380 [Nitrosomonas sp.]|nr:hypothetical protein [Nitrosomonas sp.]OQW82043.1 MAG: hypothetical protein BVN30_09770 [Proteobacteria bacterium ST_bin16]TXI42020.1 MAG: hypothetical protein E6Q59_01380 [Nitrosomonas sp.]
MSQYLARLKEVENEKNFNNYPGMELTKPPKDTYVSFVSSDIGESEKNFNDQSENSEELGLPSVSFVSSVSEENKKISDIQSLQIEIVRAWLLLINEPQEDHDLVLDKCRNDPDAMTYFLKHARGEYEIIL